MPPFLYCISKELFITLHSDTAVSDTAVSETLQTEADSEHEVAGILEISETISGIDIDILRYEGLKAQCLIESPVSFRINKVVAYTTV